jgi:hypothetical protein
MSDEAVGPYPGGGPGPAKCSQTCGDNRGPKETRGDERGRRAVQPGTIGDEKGGSGGFAAHLPWWWWAECSQSVSGSVDSTAHRPRRPWAPRRSPAPSCPRPWPLPRSTDSYSDIGIRSVEAIPFVTATTASCGRSRPVGGVVYRDGLAGIRAQLELPLPALSARPGRHAGASTKLVISGRPPRPSELGHRDHAAALESPGRRSRGRPR